MLGITLLRPHRLRVLEALGCGAVTACGTAMLYFLKLLPVAGAMSGGALAAWIALPTAMAMMIGRFVPHIYRQARLAAAARREAAAPAAAASEATPRISWSATTAPASEMTGEQPGWTPLRRRARGEPKPPAKAA